MKAFSLYYESEISKRKNNKRCVVCSKKSQEGDKICLQRKRYGLCVTKITTGLQFMSSDLASTYTYWSNGQSAVNGLKANTVKYTVETEINLYTFDIVVQTILQCLLKLGLLSVKRKKNN